MACAPAVAVARTARDALDAATGAAEMSWRDTVMTQTELYDKLDEVTAERDALASRLDGYEKAFAYLEAHVFELKWDGTLGRPFTWHMAGPYRHELAKWKGDSLIDALSSLVVERREPVESDAVIAPCARVGCCLNSGHSGLHRSTSWLQFE